MSKARIILYALLIACGVYSMLFIPTDPAAPRERVLVDLPGTGWAVIHRP